VIIQLTVSMDFPIIQPAPIAGEAVIEENMREFAA
jgi:hypothetical protein